MVGRHAGSDALSVFGSPDHLKLRSSLTHFFAVAHDPEPFERVLAVFLGGEGCGRTAEVVAAWRGKLDRTT